MTPAERSSDVTRYLDDPSPPILTCPCDSEHVGVVHYPASVHRVDVRALEERNELRDIPAGNVYEVTVHDGDGDIRQILGPYDGPAVAAEVAARTAADHGIPLRKTIRRVTPGGDDREERRRTGRWPPHRDQARRFAARIPDDVDESPNDHDVCLRVVLRPDPEPPTDDSVPLDEFDDRYDVVIAHNAGSPYDVVATVESDIESRSRAIDVAITTARAEGRPVYSLMTLPPLGDRAPDDRPTGS